MADDERKERAANALGGVTVDVAKALAESALAGQSETEAAAKATVALVASLGKLALPAAGRRVFTFWNGLRRWWRVFPDEEIANHVATKLKDDECAQERWYTAMRTLLDSVDPAAGGPLGVLTAQELDEPRATLSEYRGLARALCEMSALEMDACRNLVGRVVEAVPPPGTAWIETSEVGAARQWTTAAWRVTTPGAREGVVADWEPSGIDTRLYLLLYRHELADWHEKRDGMHILQIQSETADWVHEILSVGLDEERPSGASTDENG